MKAYRLNNLNAYIRYHDLPGADMPILFIHGLGCASSQDYPEVASQDALSGHRRILVDLLGCGFSDKPEDFSYSVPAHAAYLLDFIEALGLDRFILFGHSLGGAVALSLASLCPDRIHQLIVSESNLDAGGGSTSRGIVSYTLSDFIAHGQAEMAEANRRDGNHMWAATFSVSSPVAMHRWSQSAVDGVVPSWREIIYTLPCPKTYIYGEKTLPDEWMDDLLSHGVQIEIVKDAGHSMALENPKGLAEAIRNGIMLS